LKPGRAAGDQDLEQVRLTRSDAQASRGTILGADQWRIMVTALQLCSLAAVSEKDPHRGAESVYFLTSFAPRFEIY